MRPILFLYRTYRHFSTAICRPALFHNKRVVALDLDGTITSIPWLREVPLSTQAALQVTKPHFVSFIQKYYFWHQFYIVSCNEKQLIHAYLSQLFQAKHPHYIQGIIAADGFLPLAQSALTNTQQQIVQTLTPLLSDDDKKHHLLMLQHLTLVNPSDICLIDDRMKHVEEAYRQGMDALPPMMAQDPLLFEKLFSKSDKIDSSELDNHSKIKMRNCAN